MSDKPASDGHQKHSVDVMKAFQHDVQVALGRSVDRDDRSTLVLDVLGKYLVKFSEAMLKSSPSDEEKTILKQQHYIPSLFFEAAQIIGTHHDFNRDKIKDANDHMIRLYRVGMEAVMSLKEKK